MPQKTIENKDSTSAAPPVEVAASPSKAASKRMTQSPYEHIPPRIDIDETTISLGSLPNVQVLAPDGTINPRIDQSRIPQLSDAELLRIHRSMVLTRKFDIRMLNMQRQGEMGTFAPGFGQEATQIGQVYPLQNKDWYSPSYRSFGAQIWRGWPMEQLMLLWDGFFEGFAPPADVNDMPFSIVIGSHVPVATGIAMAARRSGDDAVAVVNFGDGALSQGIVSESFNFAAVDNAPVVFICENNGYAISVPVQMQSGNQILAARGVGFDIPAYRVDGNDILAMIHVCNEAVERARKGGGPSIIEAITYRMSVHTTADDPKVYREDDEVEQWKSKCPIQRFETHLKSQGLLDDAKIESIGAECEQEVLDAREAFRAKANANPREVFDFMFADMPPELAEQQAEYFAKLDRKGVE